MPTTTPEPGSLFLFDRPASNTPALSQEMRDNFTALARTNITTDAAFPVDAREGMLRINASDPNDVRLEVALIVAGSLVWRTIAKQLQLAKALPTKLIADFGAPTNPWVVDHNLGSQPLAQAYNASWFAFQVVPQGGPIAAGQCTVEHPSPNRVIITFAAGATGHLIVVG
jgi:hypothetical protein